MVYQSFLLTRSVGNESLEVESLESMSSPESSPSLFVQQLESSQFAPHTRVKPSQFTCRLQSSLESATARPIKLLKILTCGNLHIQFYYEAIARHKPIL